MKTMSVLAPTANAPTKKARGICITPFCRKPAKRGKSCCAMCCDRKWRAAHPEHHLWNNLKKSAKRRGVPFTLTVAEFKDFCARTGYHLKVGRNPLAFSCDRIDDRRGYSADNIRCLEFGANAGRPKERNTTETEPLPYYTPEEDPLAM